MGPCLPAQTCCGLMRVGVISPEFPPDIGGVETYACEFSRELARRGHGVTVFTQAHAKGEVQLPGIAVQPCLRMREALDRSILRDHAVDVWHVMNAAYAWVATYAPAVVVSVHGNDFLHPYVRVAQPTLDRLPWLWRSSSVRPRVEEVLGGWLTGRSMARSLPQATHIYANSRYTEEVFVRKYPACRGRTSAAMVGVSPDFLLDPLTLSPVGTSRLVTVCRLSEPRKNVDRVLRALAKLKDRYRFSYTVIGDGPLRPGLERLAGELGLQDRVRFAGFVDSRTLRSLLAESDLFILASSVHRGSHEGFGIAYLEANACGTPVLAAKLAGAIEAVQDGVSGFFVDSPEVQAIAAALEQFFCKEVQFDRASCRDFAARFTWKRVVDHALSYYPAGRS
jgi:phosphatidyl-myo-inositol dimannoside synthase